MDKKEFALFCSALRTFYPKENLLPNEQSMELWYIQLQDIPYKTAVLILNKWVATNKWSPSISDIREQAVGIMEKDKDWGEAWADVLKAIQKFGYVSEKEAMASLDELTQRAVRRLGFRNLCWSEDIQIDRANFRMIYETEQKRAKEEAQLPPRLKELIKGIGKNDNMDKSLPG